jgi:hypothetical protein
VAFRARDYAENWKEVSLWVRRERAQDRCECSGECGLHPGMRCIEFDGEPAIYANGKVTLTVAHLDADGGPCTCKRDTGIKCAEPTHLKAMCNRCHLRYDAPHHQRNARETRQRKQAVATLPGMEGA